MLRTGILAMSVFLVLSGCASMNAHKGVTLPQMKEAIVKDFHDMDEDTSITDLIGMAGEANKTRVETIIHNRQCKFKNSNPVIIFVGDVTLGLKGTWTATAGVTGSGTPEVTYSVARGDEQNFTLPMSVMSLSAIPDKYLELELKGFQNLKDFTNAINCRETPLPAALQTELNEVIKRYLALKAEVDSLQKIDLKTCPEPKKEITADKK